MKKLLALIILNIASSHALNASRINLKKYHFKSFFEYELYKYFKGQPNQVYEIIYSLSCDVKQIKTQYDVLRVKKNIAHAQYELSKYNNSIFQGAIKPKDYIKKANKDFQSLAWKKNIISQNYKKYA